jgi:ferredoxin--NADP+ reductase
LPWAHGRLVYRILHAETLAPGVTRFRVDAPRVARHQRPGQFVLVRVTDRGERIPLTIAEADADEGWIGLIVQAVGASTMKMAALEAGDSLADVAGPLGIPAEIGFVGSVLVIGGGVGTAIAYPTAVAFAAAGNDVTAIVGGRTRELMLLEPELRSVCAEVLPVTDDGSHGVHGVVTDVLADLLDAGHPIDLVLAIGPIPMMKAVAESTRPHGIPTQVSLNPIMVDGTGMCGGCRVTVDGETRFACIDGPEFDAHLVDFDELARRNRSYADFEEDRRRSVAMGASGGT